MPKKKGIIVETLMEGLGGELVFRPVEFNKPADARKLLETKNSMLKDNVKKSLELHKAKNAARKIV